MIGDPVVSLAAMGFDASLLLGSVAFLFRAAGDGESVSTESAELRFIACHCDRLECSGVRRVWRESAV